MKINKKNKAFIFIVFLLLTYGCGKIENTYSNFIGKGEEIYIARPDSIFSSSGKNRIEIKWSIPTDPRVTEFKILWNGGKDSVGGLISEKRSGDKIKVLIEDLEEGRYFFDVYQYDEANNRSVKYSIEGSAFGKLFQKTLLNRPINNFDVLANGILLKMGTPSENQIFTEIKYLNNEGDTMFMRVPNNKEIDTIENISLDSKLYYRSVFLPNPSAIDSFYTDFDTSGVLAEVADLHEEELDRSIWADASLDNDANKSLTAGTVMTKMWDGDNNSMFRVDQDGPNADLPSWITIDLGQTALLTNIKVYLKSGDIWIYNKGEVKEFEIWGSNNPSQSGDWNDWDSLGSYEMIKPSGLPLGELTSEDKDFAANGQGFEIDHKGRTYHYVRLKTLSTWEDRLDVTWGEMYLYGLPE